MERELQDLQGKADELAAKTETQTKVGRSEILNIFVDNEISWSVNVRNILL